MAKMQREKMVRDRRDQKREKKRAAAAERKAREDGTLPPIDDAPEPDVTEPTT
jgi:hypothetical protein